MKHSNTFFIMHGILLGTLATCSIIHNITWLWIVCIVNMLTSLLNAIRTDQAKRSRWYK